MNGLKWEPLVTFPDQSESFVLGVEAGIFYQRISAGEKDFTIMVHTSNIGCLLRMSATRGLSIKVEPTTVPEWSNIVVKPRSTLRVVT